MYDSLLLVGVPIPTTLFECIARSIVWRCYYSYHYNCIYLLIWNRDGVIFGHMAPYTQIRMKLHQYLPIPCLCCHHITHYQICFKLFGLLLNIQLRIQKDFENTTALIYAFDYLLHWSRQNEY